VTLGAIVTRVVFGVQVVVGRLVSRMAMLTVIHLARQQDI
jgi:hypothetical protein